MPRKTNPAQGEAHAVPTPEPCDCTGECNPARDMTADENKKARHFAPASAHQAHSFDRPALQGIEDEPMCTSRRGPAISPTDAAIWATQRRDFLREAADMEVEAADVKLRADRIEASLAAEVERVADALPKEDRSLSTIEKRAQRVADELEHLPTHKALKSLQRELKHCIANRKIDADFQKDMFLIVLGFAPAAAQQYMG